MKLEAWPVEPPGLGSGPLSIWTMSGPSEIGEMPDEAVADDAGADDDDIGLLGSSLTWCSLC